MAQGFTDLSGRWLGRYDYQNAAEPVPFEAELTEELGMIDGLSSETNTFRPELGAVLDALLSGARTQQDVQFSKRYLGFAQPALTYQGTVNGTLTRIEGTWSFPPAIGGSGRFVMMRKPLASARKQRAQVMERVG